MTEALIKQHIPLYLKYRPGSINELVGQDAVKQTLLNAIQHNRLSHAFLFVGPRGTGKTSTARILAKSLNCVNGPTTAPCQTCASCIEIAAGTSPAVFEIDAASNNSVEDARALIEKAPLVAAGGKYKIYIIDECHMLSREAFNALLKTLEEPPPNVIFVLATTEEHKVPATITSRCQKLLFRLLSYITIIDHLSTVAKNEKLEIEPAAIEIIARQARGGMRDALSILDQASLLSAPGAPVLASDLLSLLGALSEDVLLSLSLCILQGDGKSIVDNIEHLLMEGREPAAVASELSAHFLNLLRACYSSTAAASKTSAAQIAGSSHYTQALHEQAKQTEPLELTQIIEQLDQLEQLCRRSSQPAMQFEVGLLAICYRHHIPNLQDLADRVSRLESTASGAVPPAKKPAAVQPVAAQTRKQPRAVHSTQACEPATQQAQASTQKAPAAVPTQPPQVTAAQTQQAQTPTASASQLEIKRAADTSNAPASKQAADNAASDAHSASPSAIPMAPFWSKLLSTLEEHHRPTWSLVSTHAFPIRVSERELVIGVTKEQFQKMIEVKADHVRAAARAITGNAPILHVRVADNNTLAAEASPQPASARDDNADNSSSSKHSTNEVTGTPKQTTKDNVPTVARKRDPAPAQDTSSTLKEAYRLFEGPGSRQIG